MRSAYVLARLHRAVASATPPGIGAWPPALTMTDGAGRALETAVEGYEAGGERGPLVEAASRYLDAWRTAAAEYLADAE